MLINKALLTVQYKPNIKAVNNKSSSKIQDIFDIEPQKALIPPHGHVFASVTFSPKEIKPFECIFEASVESSVKSKPLSFNVCGEGALPQVAILYPAVKNNLGHAIINFRRVLL